MGKKAAALAGAGALLLAAGLQREVQLTRFRLSHGSIPSPLRLAVAADLHGTLYGRDQRRLAELLRELRPDAVLFPGDTDDGVRPAAPALMAVEKAAEICPVFLVLGNHELLLRSRREMTRAFEGAGATVLDGERVRFDPRRDGGIDIAGLSDHWCRPETQELFRRKLADAAPEPGSGRFTLLLAHRPELWKTYFEAGFQLAVTGHAHGGQWRLPGTGRGLYAPGQGLFPRWTGGLYRLPGGRLLVSRGLALGNTPVPRLFNPPELPLLELLPGG